MTSQYEKAEAGAAPQVGCDLIVNGSWKISVPWVMGPNA